MLLTEPIDRINDQLRSEFGLAFDGQPNFRVVFADDQLEKRFVWHTPEGFELLRPEVREKYKYRQTFAGFYILERLVPVVGESDLVENISYEPAWVFRDKDGNYLPPIFDACKFVVETIFAQMSKAGTHTKYRDVKETDEEKQKLLDDMESKLFGNETPVGDALAHKYGVTVPGMPTPAVRAGNTDGDDNG